MNKPILVILAAGFGSRFGGLKQIASVDKEGHKIIDFSLYDAYRAGFRRVVFIITHAMEKEFKEEIGLRMEKIFDVKYAYQELDKLPGDFTVPKGRTKPWGTGHAVLCAMNEIDDSFAVINSDDYYGVHAIGEIFKFLTTNHNPKEHAMVAYLVKNTVTESGYVSRGICKVKDGYLKDIEELVHVEKRGDDAAYTIDGTNFIPLSGEKIVSMNLWGFKKEILSEFKSNFPDFLSKNISKNPLKCEYYLPYVVEQTLKKKHGKVKVLMTKDKWFGVTYHEDLESVLQAIAQKKKASIYPEKLWN